MTPPYIKLYKDGILEKRIKSAYKLLENCSLCPRKCGVNRLKDQKGTCQTGLKAHVSSFFLHQGEEPPISGEDGSGTIFFTYCNLKCAYCQNYKLSQLGEGREVDETELADFMIQLQKQGAHNINFVTPTHVMPQILKALSIAAKSGLKIPLVYNTGGYEEVSVLKLLSGIVDVYLADMRYSNNEMSRKYSQAQNYPLFNQKAVIEMYKQVGNAKINSCGVIEKGLIIRHLVLPNNISGTKDILPFIKDKISPQCYISLMSQYCPYHKAGNYPQINRRVTLEEYQEAIDLMDKLSLSSGWIQESRGLIRFAGENIKPNI
ncbi:MAG TPA: 4Fe-4S cluster-binding domain-containing protein [Candidatus Omnitrophica bacterium]|nr:4Fe-4S cluster-binding domain-containing protein [Candidatus Omnitrophota bacterium]